MSSPLSLSPAGLDLIKRFESLQLRVYLCPANKMTIGYGHVLLPKWDKGLFGNMSSETLARIISDCQSRKALTQEAQSLLRIAPHQADELLQKDAQQTALFLNSIAAYGINQNQFDALVSLVFNIGQGNFAISTLRKKLFANDWPAAAAEFDKWVFTTQNGRKIKLNGLITRRAAERALFEKPV